MSSYKVPESKIETDKDARVVLFISRNKDNKGVPGFKERKHSFLTTRKPEELDSDFQHFVNEGVTGEMCRFYMSVNTRDMNKVKKALIHELIDSNSNKELLYSESQIAGIAARKENASTKHWLLDVDTKSGLELGMVLRALSKYTKIIADANTPNGHHIVVEHGFDTRKFLENFPYVTIKRDDLALMSWATREEDTTESKAVDTDRKKTWLVYLVMDCQMGSEGWSGWCYYCTAKGDTDEEIYHDWLKNVKKIYGVDLSKDLWQNEDGHWSCYYDLAKNELPSDVYGWAKPLKIEKCYEKHKD